jgi:hypothetical protein
MLEGLKNSTTSILIIFSLGFWIRGKSYFTVRSLDFMFLQTSPSDPPSLLLPLAPCYAPLLPSAADCQHRPPPLQLLPGATSCSGGLHVSLFPFPGPAPLPCCPPPRVPQPPELTAGRRACQCHCQLLLARAVPLPALKHAQQLLHDLLYSLTHFSFTAFPFPERSPSPEGRLSLSPPSSAAHTASHP